MTLPDRLDTIASRLAAAPKDLRVQMLLQFSRKVPDLPEGLAGDRGGALERVHECQTPFFVATRVADDGTVELHFDCPPETPTIRGFAGILKQGLDGLPSSEVLDIPPDFYTRMGLAEIVSPLRLRGMGAILARIKRQIRESEAARQ